MTSTVIHISAAYTVSILCMTSDVIHISIAYSMTSDVIHISAAYTVSILCMTSDVIHISIAYSVTSAVIHIGSVSFSLALHAVWHHLSFSLSSVLLFIYSVTLVLYTPANNYTNNN